MVLHLAQVPGESCDLEKMGSFSHVVLIDSHVDGTKCDLGSLNVGYPFNRQKCNCKCCFIVDCLCLSTLLFACERGFF